MKFRVPEELTKRFAWFRVTLNDGGLDRGTVIWMETYYVRWDSMSDRISKMSKLDGEHVIDIRRRVNMTRREYEASLLS